MIAGTAFATEYVVKPNESLSEIAHRTIPGPVWGSKGSFSQVLMLNPNIKNSNLIFVGETIQIPESRLTENTVDPENRTPSTEEPLPPEAPPSSVPSNPSSNQAFGAFSLDTGFSSSRISATEIANGSQAKLLTQSNFHEEFSYLQHWSGEFQTRVYFGLQSLNFTAPDSGGTLNDSSPTLHQFGIEGQFDFTNTFSAGFGLGMNQNPYLAAVSVSTIMVDSLYVPRLNFFLSKEFYAKGPFRLGLKGTIGISAPTSNSIYSTRTNLDYAGTLFVKQEAFSWLNIETGAKCSYFNQNTSIADQSMLDLGVYLKLTFPFGVSAK